MNFDPGLKPGDTITNGELMKIFKCANSSGMRRSHETKTLVIISDYTRSLYDNRWINNVFHYTGMGQKGHQSLKFAQNKTLAESDQNAVKVYLFEVFKSNEYIYIGQVRLADKPYQEIQDDFEGKSRKVWVFPLKLLHGKPKPIAQTIINEKQAQKQKKATNLTDEELKKRAQSAKKQPGQRNTTTSNYERDEFVAEYAKRRAKGNCQLCENPAPFVNKEGNPFLETHHIEWLSQGGDDTIENTVALCPNCHRKLHSLNLKKDKDKLKNAISQPE